MYRYIYIHVRTETLLVLGSNSFKIFHRFCQDLGAFWTFVTLPFSNANFGKIWQENWGLASHVGAWRWCMGRWRRWRHAPVFVCRSSPRDFREDFQQISRSQLIALLCLAFHDSQAEFPARKHSNSTSSHTLAFQTHSVAKQGIKSPNKKTYSSANKSYGV